MAQVGARMCVVEFQSRSLQAVPAALAIFKLANFASTDLRTSGSGWGSTFPGKTRQHWSHFSCVHFGHFDSLGAMIFLHTWQLYCTFLLPGSSPGYP